MRVPIVSGPSRTGQRSSLRALPRLRLCRASAPRLLDAPQCDAARSSARRGAFAGVKPTSCQCCGGWGNGQQSLRAASKERRGSAGLCVSLAWTAGHRISEDGWPICRARLMGGRSVSLSRCPSARLSGARRECTERSDTRAGLRPIPGMAAADALSGGHVNARILPCAVPARPRRQCCLLGN